MDDPPSEARAQGSARRDCGLTLHPPPKSEEKYEQMVFATLSVSMI
jgi:hypothetical protein